MKKRKLETQVPQESGFVKWKRSSYEARAKRDTDPVRAARAVAYSKARSEPECTDAQAIAAANEAEIAVRTRMGVDEPLDTSKPAIDWPCYPSDIRSVDHWHVNE